MGIKFSDRALTYYAQSPGFNMHHLTTHTPNLGLCADKYFSYVNG